MVLHTITKTDQDLIAAMWSHNLTEEALASKGAHDWMEATFLSESASSSSQMSPASQTSSASTLYLTEASPLDGQELAAVSGVVLQAEHERKKSNKASGGGGVAHGGGATGGKAATDEEICTICGDRASGYHYNALSCEGCKGFFRRSITRAAKYACKYGGNCEMDMWMRRRCQSCRLRRCKEVGMKEECLLSDEQCRARDVRRKIKLQRKKALIPDQDAGGGGSSSSGGKGNQQLGGSSSVGSSHPSSADTDVASPQEADQFDDENMSKMSEEHREIIYMLVRYQDMFELPKDEDVAQVTRVRVSDIGRPKQLNETIYKQMAEMTILVTQLVVEFAKNLPGFQACDREDQITLLKGSASEVMMLRSARRYDLESDTIIFANGMPYTRDNMRMAGLNDYVDSLFTFCKKMGGMAVDNAEYAMLTAICIFSDRTGLKNPRMVEEHQERFTMALQEYVSHRRPKNSQHFAKLLFMLTDLREASLDHAEVLFSLKVEKGSLPPLLSEYFDVV